MSNRALLLRADAGPTIGVGHVSRCVAFAEEAVRRGWPVVFSGRLAGAAWLTRAFVELNVPLLDPVDDAAALAELAARTGAEIALVDHYRLPGDPRSALAGVGARLISMEDGQFGRRPADIVVDCGLVDNGRVADGSATVLCGPRFAPLRAMVRTARQTRAGRPNRSSGPCRVVVALGGGQATETLRAVLVALRDTRLPLEVLAVASGSVESPMPGPDQRITVCPPRPNLPDLFATADLVVSAAGVTLLELCCIGVPTALLCVADNQAVAYRAALARGLAVGLGMAEDLVGDAATRLLRELLLDPARRLALARAAATAVDGHGAGRVLDHLD